jgi:hypothetical protein
LSDIARNFIERGKDSEFAVAAPNTADVQIQDRWSLLKAANRAARRIMRDVALTSNAAE